MFPSSAGYLFLSSYTYLSHKYTQERQHYLAQLLLLYGSLWFPLLLNLFWFSFPAPEATEVCLLLSMLQGYGLLFAIPLDFSLTISCPGIFPTSSSLWPWIMWFLTLSVTASSDPHPIVCGCLSVQQHLLINLDYPTPKPCFGFFLYLFLQRLHTKWF